MHLTPRKGTTRAVKLLYKESEQSDSEQCSSDEETQLTSSSGTTEDSSKKSSASQSDRFTPGSDHDDTDDEDVTSEYPSEDEPLERTRSKTKNCGSPIGKTKKVVLDAEGLSQISEWSFKSATTLTDTQEVDDQEMEFVMEKYVQKQDNASSMLNFFGRSKFKSLCG